MCATPQWSRRIVTSALIPGIRSVALAACCPHPPIAINPAATTTHRFLIPIPYSLFPFRFHGPHQPQCIPPVEHSDLRMRVAALEECLGQMREIGDALEPHRRALDAVEVAADADMLDAGYLHRVVNVVHHVAQRRGRRLLFDEVAVEIDLDHAAV